MESGLVRGFGLVPGVIGHFESSSGLRVPHMGWNALYTVKDSERLGDFGNCVSILFILPMSCHQMMIKSGFHPPTKMVIIMS